jgi:molecular chaperone GrpE
MSKFEPKGQSIAYDASDDDDDIEILEIVGLDADPHEPFVGEEPADAAESADLILDFDQDGESDERGREGDAADGGGERARFLRLQADFENYKKRVEREREADQRQASVRVVDRLLPVLDNFERAIFAATESGDQSSLCEGVQLIFRHLLDELRREGLESIDSVGQPFDPKLHEAVATDSSNDMPHNMIVEEMLRGYTLHGRLLRPSLVRVSVHEGKELTSGSAEGGSQHG